MTLSDSGKSRKIKEVASHASIFEEDQEGRNYPAQGSKTKAGETGKEIFKGRELGDIDSKELKRIQIDIKRSIPSHRVSTSPIRRRVVNPKTVVISRRKPEGKRPIFDRDEIRDWDTAAAAEKRSINLVGRDRSRSPRKRGGDPTPPSSSARMRQDGNGDSGSVRSRLGQKRARSRDGSPNYGRRRRLDGEGNGGDGPSPLDARDRLNRQRRRNDFDPNRVLDREELESRRPDIKPWDINPEFVPKGINYFEHDDRNDDADDAGTSVFFGGGGRGWRGGGGFQRGFRGGYRGSRGGFNSRAGRGRGYNYGRGGDENYGRAGDDGREWGDSANRRRLPDRLRRRTNSPSKWGHDLFDEISKDEAVPAKETKEVESADVAAMDE